MTLRGTFVLGLNLWLNLAMELSVSNTTPALIFTIDHNIIVRQTIYICILAHFEYSVIFLIVFVLYYYYLLVCWSSVNDHHSPISAFIG